MQRWMHRAQTGHADEVLAETDVAMLDGEWAAEPAQSRMFYARAVGLVASGRYEQALTEVEAMVALCQQIGSLAFEAVGHAQRAEIHAYLGRTAMALDALARCEVLIDDEMPEHRPGDDWAVAVTLHGAACIRLRLLRRSIRAQERFLDIAEVEEHTTLTRYTLGNNLAWTRLTIALAALRRPPFAVDKPEMERASAAAQTAALIPIAAELQVHTDHDLWTGLRLAWTGDPAHALELVSRFCDPSWQPILNDCWEFPIAARIRATNRLGDAAALAQVVTDTVALLPPTANGNGSAGPTLAWELLRARYPDVEQPSSELGSLSLEREEELRLREVELDDVVGLRVEHIRAESERAQLTVAYRTDALTGVLNRRGFEPYLAEAAADPRHDSTLIVLDLDGLKRLNDSRGHLAGDAALEAFSSCLRAAITGDGVVARIGGDEFVVLVPGADSAPELADRILDECRNRLAAQYGIATSLGVSVRNGPVDPRKWLAAADAAMYRAKGSGGDRAAAATYPTAD